MWVCGGDEDLRGFKHTGVLDDAFQGPVDAFLWKVSSGVRGWSTTVCCVL